MKFTIDKRENYVIIEPHVPVLNGNVARKLKAEFLLRNTGGQKNIVLNLKRVQSTDEEGIRVGILANRLCRTLGGVFILMGVNDEIYEFIELTLIKRDFFIVKNLKEARRIIEDKERINSLGFLQNNSKNEI